MKKLPNNFVKINLIFIFIFINIWDFAVNRQFFNGMAMGLVMFAPIAFLWFLNSFKATVLLTLISIFEFLVLLIFLVEGFELSGLATTLKSIFWLPFLVLAFLNMYWGLKIYSEEREGEKK